MAPPAPAGTIAAFPVMVPSMAFSVETNGCGWLSGQNERYPRDPDGTTVAFSE